MSDRRGQVDEEAEEMPKDMNVEQWFQHIREKELRERMKVPPKAPFEMKYMKVKVLRHFGDLSVPAHQTSGASGLDLPAALDGAEMVIQPGKMAVVPTGICVEVFRGFEAQVRSRSGLAFKNNVFVLNSPGTIDSDYRGEIKVMLMNLGEEPFTVKHGDRIAQLVVCPYQPVTFYESDELSDTTRGQNGFGSTGK